MAAEMPHTVRLRQIWWSIHRWIGLGLMILLLPIAISGALLVYHDGLDALLNPKRWAVTGAELALSPTQYLEQASKELAPNEHAIGIRYPQDAGDAVRVLLRQQAD